MTDLKEVRIVLDEWGMQPTRSSFGAAAFDCYSRDSVDLLIDMTTKVSLGFSMSMPKDLCAVLMPRSGLATRHGLVLGNTLGLIDSDYRGPVTVALKNTGTWVHHVNKGDRICQMLFLPVPSVALKQVLELDATDRGSKGFGSTGT